MLRIEERQMYNNFLISKQSEGEGEREREIMDEEVEEAKGTVCVTGGTGYVASWLIMKLLQHGYSVHATVRFSDSSGMY